MRVSVKRADLYDRAAREAANRIRVETGLVKSVFDAVLVSQSADMAAALADEARRKLEQQVVRTVQLLDAAYTIRRQLGRAFEPAISGLIAQRVHVGALIAKLEAIRNDMASSVGEPDAVSARAKAAAARQSASSSEYSFRGSPGTVTINLVTPEVLATVEDRLATLRARQRELNEELTAANVATHIVLDDTTVATLRSEKIITYRLADHSQC